MDHWGIVFEDPENAVEDQEGFKVSIPEARLEVLISFGMGAPAVIVDEEEESDVVIPPPIDESVIPLVVPPVTPPTTPPVSPPVEPPVDESDLGWLYTTFIAIIAGILGALGNKYKWIKGFTAMWKARSLKANTPEQKRKNIKSGLKAIATVIRKDREGKYKR